MRIEPLGESAVILREIDSPIAVRSAAALLPGVVDAVASYDTVGVYFDPETFDPRSLESLASIPAPTVTGRRHTVPVCYELGEDLVEAAESLAISKTGLIEAHTAVDYTCFAIGFSPGFPYLGYLPEILRGLGRRAQPRLKVAAGSVAITGKQTGIYPNDSPGGWHIVGRTPLVLVDLADRYFPIEAGDTVRFEAIPLNAFEELQGQRL